MKVKVTGPYQVVHEEKVYTEGDTIDAPDVDAQEWVTAGYVEEVKAAAVKSDSGSKPATSKK